MAAPLEKRLCEDSAMPTKWPLARVIEVHPGKLAAKRYNVRVYINGWEALAAHKEQSEDNIENKNEVTGKQTNLNELTPRN